MATKNLGQVSGLWIGTSAPSNTSLIWYDSTPAIRCHKVYSASLSAWVVLDQSSISSITYIELGNLARGTGLTQGSWYKITDQGNILALAITTTKVQYVDVNNNFVIDDLAASATYAVTSSNLLIDDISGVWDADNNLLKFSFTETAHDGNTNDDFIFGKKQRGGVWSLAKYKLSSLISAVKGNSVTWNKGIFFNFNAALSSKTDVVGGVVGKNTYDSEKATMNQNIANVAASNQAILNTAKNYADSKVAPSAIYSKALPSAPTSGAAIDIAQGDTLSEIITKIHRWITQFKVATGIKVSKDFAPATQKADINNNDTVDSALRKIQYWFNNIELSLSADWHPSKDNSDVKAGDDFQDAFAKLQGKFNHIYENGLRFSKFSNGESWVDSHGVGSSACDSSIYPGSFAIDDSVSVAGLGYRNKSREAELSTDDTNIRSFVAGVAGAASNNASNPCDTFGGYFEKLKALGLYLRARRVLASTLLSSTDDIITCYNTENDISVTLPNSPMCGKVVIVVQINSREVTVVSENKKIRVADQNLTSTTIGGAGKMAILLFDGQLWSCVKIG